MTKFNEITKEDVRKMMDFLCKVEEIKQTSGPTIFTLYDGTKTIKSTGFIKPGVRAFPSIEAGDFVNAKGFPNERDGTIEIEVKGMIKMTSEEEASFALDLKAIEDETAKPADVPFLVDNEVLRALKPNMVKVATEIRRAIFTNRRIILKHHADCDGYSAGIALERAILPLIKQQHSDLSATWFYYKRGPSKAPFYEYVDVIKDLSYSIDDMNRFGQKPPLVILADNGSTEEDLLAIKKLKIYGAKIVVVDHHFPGEVVNEKVAVDEYVDAHVNPYLVGFDSTLCAGVLATEVGRMINKDIAKVKHIPALAAMADRSKGPIIDQYIAIAEKAGLDKEYLRDLGEVIDFESYYLRFMEARGLVNDLFGDNVPKQREMVKLLIVDINKKKNTALLAARHYMSTEDINGQLVMTLEADQVTSRGAYPAIGKTTGIAHDSLIQDNPGKPIISMGLGPDFITLRMSDEVNMSVAAIVTELQEKLPYGNIDGGGHEHAGSIKFLSGAHDEVHKIVFNKLRNGL